jgi:hypothetical protein
MATQTNTKRQMTNEFRRLALAVLDGVELDQAEREVAPKSPVTPRLRPQTAEKVRADLAKLKARGKPQSQAFAERMLELYPSLQGDQSA